MTSPEIHNSFASSPETPQACKRRKTDRSRVGAAYPRKRAVAACQLCRARKIKCNNARPACSSCLTSASRCLYEDPKDHSAFDPASILILDRLDQVLTRLDRNANPGEASSGSVPAYTPSATRQSHDGEAIRDPIETSHDELRIPSAQTTIDSILSWPVFGGQFPASYVTDAVFHTEDADDLVNTSSTLAQSRRKLPCSGGIDEERIPELIETFLRCVHIKNPILDAGTLRMLARGLCEDGIKWDAGSCLVLIASALGCVARPFAHELPHAGLKSIECDAAVLQAGANCFNLARKRMGFLTDGILGAQCHFLSGVYLMYTMQPLAAWSHFHSASRSYHMYLQIQARRCAQPEDPASTSRRRSLEQSLYWSCYKAECELRIEINLPHSSLADLHYPDAHPMPAFAPAPSSSIFETSPQEGWNDLIRHDVDSRQENDTWFYYLTEITLRRINNSILNTLYLDDYTTWDDEQVPYFMRAAAQFKEQLAQWYAKLPDPILYSEEETPTEELPYMVRGRVLGIQLAIHQPFLFFAIHKSHESLYRDSVLPMAQTMVRYCFQCVENEPIRHRHHGTWLGIRFGVAACLCIVAAVRSHVVAVPSNWKDILTAYMDRLRYWKDELPGIAETITILQHYLTDAAIIH